ncbi:MAG: DUF2784 domain-containing protein [Acidobacteria bacterium]|nr:DUF2784 domain-containing protein [Acidobacteriota bacterium]
MYGLLADAVLVLHLGFIVFVAIGGLLALRWPRAAWPHLACVAWGVLVMATGWLCPLTPLESWLRERAGQAAIGESFIEHYLVPLIYPANLTRGFQLAAGGVAVALNIAVYALVFGLRRRSPPRRD